MFVGGDRWERQQWLNPPGELPLSGGAVGNGAPTHGRDYRAAVSFEGLAEQQFLDQCHELMESSQSWEVLGPSARTARNRTRAAIVLLRSASRMHDIQYLNRNYPNKLLASSKLSHLRDEISADLACPRRLDDGSRQVLEFYEEDLASAAAKADVNAMAILARKENIQVEYRHQRVRRFIFGRSVQRKLVDLAMCNSFWISDQLSAAFQGVWKSCTRRKTSHCRQEDEKAAEQVSQSKKRKANPFNLFRAWKADREPGMTSTQVSRAWKDLTEVEKLEWKKKGRACR